MINTDDVFLKCLIFRVLCVLANRTAFAPDEFWQGPEVAHRLVFGLVRHSDSKYFKQ